MKGSSVKCVLLLFLLLVVSSSGFAQTVTRLEENDPSIAYSGNWYSNGSSGNSGGSAALTNAPGARVVISFTGTGITWIGVADPWSGMANLYLDGVLNRVDTYGSSTRYQERLFTVNGLAAGPHTVSIEVTHERDVNGSGSWVWIDAVEIMNGEGVPGGVTAPSGLVEENNPAILYTGNWFTNGATIHSRSSAVLATDAGSRATLNFSGTGVSWIAYRDAWSGIARVYLDGDLKTTIDLYMAGSQAQATPYSIGGLVAGNHSLTIEVTGTRNQNSGGSWVWLDAFDVAP